MDKRHDIKNRTSELITDDTVPLNLSNIPSVGYLNWTDSIGHAIIGGLEVELTGLSKKLVSMDFPYAQFLDIYNELNDEFFTEWEQIRKSKVVSILKEFQTNKIILYVPLHLWFSRSTESAFPSFLFKDTQKKLTINLKIKHYKSLLISSIPASNFNNGNSSSFIPTSGLKNPRIVLMYDIMKPDINNPGQINKIDELKKYYKNNPYKIYFDKYNYITPFIPVTGGFNIPIVDTNPIKELIFVMPIKKS